MIHSYLTKIMILMMVVCLTTAARTKIRLTHEETVASIACILQNEKEVGEEGPRSWHDHEYRARYSVFHDSNEGFPGWHLVYVLVYEREGAAGWIYKLYVHDTKHMVEVGEYGTVKKNRNGAMEIDDVWGGLATQSLITKRLKIIESTPLLKLSPQELHRSSFTCYDVKHPLPD